MLRQLLETIRRETQPIVGHTDPGAIEDCWRSVFEELEAIEHAGAMDGLTYCLCGDVIPSDEYRCMNCKALEDARH